MRRSLGMEWNSSKADTVGTTAACQKYGDTRTHISVLPVLLSYILMYKTSYRLAFRSMHIHPENIEVHRLESPEKEVPL